MDWNAIVEQFKHPEIVSDMFLPEDIEKNKNHGIIVSCLGLVGIVYYLIMGRSSRYLSHCANQCATLLLFQLVVGLIGNIPFIGWLLSSILWLVVVAFWVFLLIHSINGEAVYLPVIGQKLTLFK